MEKDGPSKWLWTPLRAYETDTISGLLTLSFKLRAAERERTWKLGFPINISAILLPQQSSYLPLPLRLSPVAIGPYCNSPFPQVPLITRSLIPRTCSHQQVLGWSHSMITAVLAGSNHFFYQPWASTAFFQGHLLFTGSLCSALTCSSNISAFSFPQH